MARPDILSTYFNVDSFKAFLKSNYEVKWHLDRIKNKDHGEKWLNGLVVAANKFVYDMTAGYKEESSFDTQWTILPYKFKEDEIDYSGSDKAGYCYAVNAEFYRYEPCSTKLPDIMSRVNLYVE